MGPRQQARIARAAALYLACRPGLARRGVRFDVVTVSPGTLPRHLRDAWRPDAAVGMEIGEGGPAGASCAHAACPTDPIDYLRALGEGGEGPHDMAQAGLMLAALDHPGVARTLRSASGRDRARPAAMSCAVYRAEEAPKRCRRSWPAASAITATVCYDDPHNADLMAVIDRRRGLPVALGILYHPCRARRRAGGRGLNTPGHFLLRISVEGQHGADRSVQWRRSGRPG